MSIWRESHPVRNRVFVPGEAGYNFPMGTPLWECRKNSYLWRWQKKRQVLGTDKETPSEEENETLKKRLKELEGCLPYAELQNLALNTVIDIAEEQGIQLRKKTGPNSSPTLRAERPERQYCLQTVWPLQTGLLPTKVGQ